MKVEIQEPRTIYRCDHPDCDKETSGEDRDKCEACGKDFCQSHLYEVEVDSVKSVCETCRDALMPALGAIDRAKDEFYTKLEQLEKAKVNAG